MFDVRHAPRPPIQEQPEQVWLLLIPRRDLSQCRFLTIPVSPEREVGVQIRTWGQLGVNGMEGAVPAARLSGGTGASGDQRQWEAKMGDRTPKCEPVRDE